MFVFSTTNNDVDDDETCFATSSGRWLLECPHWDFVTANNPYHERIVTGFAKNTIVTVATASIAIMKVPCIGAQIGMASTASLEGFNDGRLAISSYVSTPNEVTVVVSNPSAGASAALPQNNWYVAAFTNN